MKYLNKYSNFENIIETNQSINKRGNKNLIQKLCVGMLLINPGFLDKILDDGIKGRYTNDTSIFITDLKNLIFANNRFKLGKFENNKFEIDGDVSKINSEFNEYSKDFDMEKDWSKLLKARKIARNIYNKISPTGEELNVQDIKYVFWLGPNSHPDINEDLIIELVTGEQLPIYIDRKIKTIHTQSFNTFADILIGDNVNHLYSDVYMDKWNKMTQQWVNIIYENSNNDMRIHINKFINPDRIGSLTYFDYFDIIHSNKKYRILGEYIPEFNKNILKLSDLLSLIYKNGELYINDFDKVSKEWESIKKFILKSKIIEHLFTESFKEMSSMDVKDGKYTLANNDMKMRLMKLFVELINVKDYDTYYFSKSGLEFNKLPNRKFFRKLYEQIDIKYDYHIKLTKIGEDKFSDFVVRYDLYNEPFAKLNIETNWSGGEMSGKLNIKMSLDLNNKFNDKVKDGEYSITESNIKFITENWDDIKYITKYSLLEKHDVIKANNYKLISDIVDDVKYLNKIFK